jgi:hypothetical protein
MSTQRDHAAELAQKIRDIQSGQLPDRLTPVEFISHLLSIHKEGDKFAPISVTEFGSKISGRNSYFTEVRRDAVRHPGRILPKSLAGTMANLTNTQPYFWRKSHYSLAEAENITLDMSKASPATTLANDTPEPSQQEPAPTHETEGTDTPTDSLYWNTRRAEAKAILAKWETENNETMFTRLFYGDGNQFLPEVTSAWQGLPPGQQLSRHHLAEALVEADLKSVTRIIGLDTLSATWRKFTQAAPNNKERGA